MIKEKIIKIEYCSSNWDKTNFLIKIYIRPIHHYLAIGLSFFKF